ncbi:MAG: pilus assembly protein [Pseudomonadota bacterium]|nr:pilus assembly protein [Pseudomonadota bacterium]
MRYCRAVARRLGEFGKDNSGSFAVITAAIMTVLVLSAGYAVNIAQLHNVRSDLKQAIDAAVTSTARDITIGKIKAEDAQEWIERFLKANGDPALVSGDRLALDRLVIDKAKSTIEVAAHVDVDLYFPLFGLSNQRRVTNMSAAVYADKKIEVAMMLDVTGSMEKKGRKDKIGDLRAAAKNAVESMLKYQDKKNPRVRVALVPYASGVNVGQLAGNVYAEKSGRSDLPPLADDSVIGGRRGTTELPAFGTYVSKVGSAFRRDDNCATERKDRNGNPDFTDDGPDTVRKDRNGKKYYALVNRDDNLSGSGMNACPDAKVIPLTADQGALLDSIGKFKASGYTAGAIAVQWTYYMLSPKWRGAIKTAKLGDGPADHDQRKISKVAILMTDGQFNTAFAGVSRNFNSQDSKARQSAETICRNMKDDKIEIFTIGFDLDNTDMSRQEREAAKSVLRNCATADSSGIKHYFEASTGEELDNALQEIISNTERLALTQ